MAKKKAAPDTVAIIATTQERVGWRLDIDRAAAGVVLPAVFPKTRRTTVPVEIELHMPERIIKLSAKRAKIVVVNKGD